MMKNQKTLALVILAVGIGILYFSGMLKLSVVSGCNGYTCNADDYSITYTPVDNYIDYDKSCGNFNYRADLAKTLSVKVNDIDFGKIKWFKNPQTHTRVDYVRPDGEPFLSQCLNFNPQLVCGSYAVCNRMIALTVNNPEVPIGTDGYNLHMENNKIKLTGTFNIDLDQNNLAESVNWRTTKIELKGNYQKLQLNKMVCNMGSDDFIGGETFAAGTAVSISSFRYPVKSFCYSNKVLITDTKTNTSYQSGVEYYQLVDGQTITIPAGKTYTFFYVFQRPADLPVIGECPQGYYDATRNACVVSSGFVYLCSAGQFDPTRGACVVQPESIYLCPDGGRYDTSLLKCVFNPPSEAICPSGTVFNSVSGKCEYSPPQVAVCNSGYVYNPTTLKCESNPPTTQICTQGSWNSELNACVYNPETQIVCNAGTYDVGLKKCIVTPETQQGIGGIPQIWFLAIAGIVIVVIAFLILKRRWVYCRRTKRKQKTRNEAMFPAPVTAVETSRRGMMGRGLR